MTEREGTFVLDASYVASRARQAVYSLVRPVGDAFRYLERTTRPKPLPQVRRGED